MSAKIEKIKEGLYNDPNIQKGFEDKYRAKNAYNARKTKKLEKKRDLEKEQEKEDKSLISRVTSMFSKKRSHTGGRKKKHRKTHKKKRSKKCN